MTCSEILTERKQHKGHILAPLSFIVHSTVYVPCLGIFNVHVK